MIYLYGLYKPHFTKHLLCTLNVYYHNLKPPSFFFCFVLFCFVLFFNTLE
ncbi:hypothetical protein FM106_21005 [Brachybacterium faecium]|nr:hypothetical protein FM106_21005 [Brachybacterium faecium]